MTFGLSVSIQSLLAAWVAPTQNPPDSTISPPLYNDGTVTNPAINRELLVNDDFYVGLNSLYVDEVNKRAGIGTASLVKNLEVQSALTGATGNFTDRPTFRLNQSNNFAYNIGDIHSALEFYSKDSSWTPGLQAYVAAATTRANGITHADAGLYFGTSNGATKALYTKPQMMIAHNGNVGIGLGTTTPLERLHVGDGALLLAQPAGFGSMLSAVGQLGLAGPSSAIYLANRSLTTWPAVPVAGDGYSFYNNGSLNIWTPVKGDLLTIAATGNVGVGTIAPTQKLDINGDLRVGGRHILLGNIQDIYGDNSSAVYYDSNNDTITQMIFRDKQDTPYGRVYGSTDGANFGLMDGDGQWSYLAARDNYTQFRINNVAKLTIYDNGVLRTNGYTPAVNADVVTKLYSDSSNIYKLLNGRRITRTAFAGHDTFYAILDFTATGYRLTAIYLCPLTNEGVPNVWWGSQTTTTALCTAYTTYGTYVFRTCVYNGQLCSEQNTGVRNCINI